MDVPYIVYEFKPDDLSVETAVKIWRAVLDSVDLQHVKLPEITVHESDVLTLAFDTEILDTKRYNLEELLWQKIEHGELRYLAIYDY